MLNGTYSFVYADTSQSHACKDFLPCNTSNFLHKAGCVKLRTYQRVQEVKGKTIKKQKSGMT